MAVYLDVHHAIDIVRENALRSAPQDRSFPPSYEGTRGRLPRVTWAGHPEATAAFDKAMELLFRNLKRTTTANGFAKPYADAAFNDCLFMWDSAFMGMQFRYAAGAGFDFLGTFDTFYRKQHEDGFISREIREENGSEQFHRWDPASTGPNTLAWAEWEAYGQSGDKARLKAIWPALAGYHLWLQKHRTWPDGSYFTCGLASGMDNAPRVQPGDSAWIDNGHQVWVDATAQAALSARILVAMAREIGRSGPLVEELRQEVQRLQHYLAAHCWDAGEATFCDRRLRVASGVDSRGLPELSSTLTIAAYWTLLAECPPPGTGAEAADNLHRFVAHLDNPAQFNRPCRPPSLAADQPGYAPDGGYWLGGVWPSTAYMVLRGLTAHGQHDCAADIGANYTASTLQAFKATGTLWENFAPEAVGAPGNPSRPDFVGWGGLGATTILLEYVFGLRPDGPTKEITWDVRLTEAFSVERYPFAGGLLSFSCAARGGLEERPRVIITSSMPVTVRLQWGKGATPVGGLYVDRSGVPPGPRHEEVLQVRAEIRFDFSGIR
jgi:hypothetical protein